jgi:hypothetical protein
MECTRPCQRSCSRLRFLVPFRTGAGPGNTGAPLFALGGRSPPPSRGTPKHYQPLKTEGGRDANAETETTKG